MEYMASGTPVLTTHLPGMPDDHKPYVFFYRRRKRGRSKAALKKFFALSDKELNDFGKRQKEFILEKKNNVAQGKKCWIYADSLPKKAEGQMILHPFAPEYDENSKILILGSFPSVKSREQMFFYGHPQNRFWKVTAAVFNSPVPQTIDEKKAFCTKKQNRSLGRYRIMRDRGQRGQHDKNAAANNLSEILENSQVKRIFVNGKTAEKYYNKYTKKNRYHSNLSAVDLSANAAWNIERLTDAWKIIREGI